MFSIDKKLMNFLLAALTVLRSGSGEEDENVKSLQTDRQTDGQTDRRRTTGDQKSSLELSAQVS